MERHGARQKDARKSVWLPEMDRLLLVGMKHGPGGIRAARKALRQLAPKLTPGEIWKRMRRLREAGSNRHHDPSQWPAEIIQHLKDGYRAGGARKREALKSCREHYQSVPSYVISRFARQNGWLQGAKKAAAGKTHRGWSKYEEELLWKLSGYESPRQIAHRLRRTESAVRYRLKAQGLSGKVKDGISLRAFQEMFHMGHRKAYALIAKGTLRVRDPRISVTSLAAFCKKHSMSFDVPAVGDVNTQKQNGTAGLSWERVARQLGASLDEVRRWLATQQLTVVDTFVTEKALEEFCQCCGRTGGPKLNFRLMEPQILDWLVKDYGITIPNAHASQSVSSFEKQALVVRVCGKCGKEFRGNVYFAHIKQCKGGIVR